MLASLHLLKYVTSFSEGRVRIRHPALRREKTAQAAYERLCSMEGVTSVEYNTLSGSVLILYDSTLLSQENLITLGIAWARWLDAIHAGQPAQMP